MVDVTVVGAGVVGASVAYHLARAGVAVTVLERASGPAAGVTGGSFAWVGNSGGEWPDGAEDLRAYVHDDFRRLEAEVAGFAVRWTGSLSFSAGSGAAPGPGQALVGASEIAELEPGWREPPEQAVYTPTDGGVDPVAVVASLLEAARGHGAEVVYGAAGGQFLPGALTVLAAGTDTGALCRRAGVNLEVGTSPACLLRVAAPPGVVKTIVAGPRFEVREVRDGELLMTIPYVVGQSADEVGQNAELAVQRLRSTFDGAAECRLLGYRVSSRPMPAHGPVVGYVKPDRSLYVAVMHAAVTLAPTVGRLIAEEIVSGEPREELARCRPGLPKFA
ncbi:MAG: FAD-binding oxidoreductase [Catenulispora sp.]|nr:FAD-binding oxidoreductase [Catenulispora sp.]